MRAPGARLGSAQPGPAPCPGGCQCAGERGLCRGRGEAGAGLRGPESLSTRGRAPQPLPDASRRLHVHGSGAGKWGASEPRQLLLAPGHLLGGSATPTPACGPFIVKLLRAPPKHWTRRSCPACAVVGVGLSTAHSWH